VLHLVEQRRKKIKFMVFVRKDLFVIYVRFILEMKMKRNSTNNNVGVF